MITSLGKSVLFCLLSLVLLALFEGYGLRLSHSLVILICLYGNKTQEFVVAFFSVYLYMYIAFNQLNYRSSHKVSFCSLLVVQHITVVCIVFVVYILQAELVKLLSYQNQC